MTTDPTDDDIISGLIAEVDLVGGVAPTVARALRTMHGAYARRLRALESERRPGPVVAADPACPECNRPTVARASNSEWHCGNCDYRWGRATATAPVLKCTPAPPPTARTAGPVVDRDVKPDNASPPTGNAPAFDDAINAAPGNMSPEVFVVAMGSLFESCVSALEMLADGNTDEEVSAQCDMSLPRVAALRRVTIAASSDWRQRAETAERALRKRGSTPSDGRDVPRVEFVKAAQPPTGEELGRVAYAAFHAPADPYMPLYSTPHWTAAASAVDAAVRAKVLAEVISVLDEACARPRSTRPDIFNVREWFRLAALHAPRGAGEPRDERPAECCWEDPLCDQERVLGSHYCLGHLRQELRIQYPEAPAAAPSPDAVVGHECHRCHYVRCVCATTEEQDILAIRRTCGTAGFGARGQSLPETVAEMAAAFGAALADRAAVVELTGAVKDAFTAVRSHAMPWRWDELEERALALLARIGSPASTGEGRRTALLLEMGQACVDWVNDNVNGTCHLCDRDERGEHDEDCLVAQYLRLPASEVRPAKGAAT